MANTTNYNWETPDDTDLVKDGAAAIRTLGSSIDTTTKALNPSTTLGDIEYRSATANTNTRLAIGTTGQVLSVVGGVPAWATSDDANAIQNAIVDAKGDIVAASAADTPARLAVGTDNQRLVAASGEATGLKYVSDTQNTVIDAAGDLVYGTAADTLGRLAIGTAGQILKVNAGATAPEWGAAAGGGGMTLLSTTSLTGSSTTISSIDQTYNNLYVLITNVYPSLDAYVLMHANSDTTTANYQASLIGLRNSTMAFRPDNKALHAYGMDGGTSRNNLIALTLFNYAGSTYKSWSSNCAIYGDDTSPFFINSFGNTIWYDTAAISSLTFSLFSGTFSGGTVKIYGVK